MLALALASTMACAGRRPSVVLPSGMGEALDVASLESEQAAWAAACGDARAFIADLRVSGRVEGERVRGTLQVGVDADAIRIEALPPIGSPVFILAGRAASATLLLPRDRAYVEASVPELTDAVVGIALAPADLRAVLSGCGVAASEVVDGRAFGREWVRLHLASGNRVWLRSDGRARRLTVAEAGNWRVDYLHEAGQSVRGVLRHTSAPTELSFTVEAPEWRDALPPEATRVVIGAHVAPIALDQLRRQRTLGES